MKKGGGAVVRQWRGERRVVLEAVCVGVTLNPRLQRSILFSN